MLALFKYLACIFFPCLPLGWFHHHWRSCCDWCSTATCKMQRVTHLPETWRFGLKPRLWDTSGPLNPYLIALQRVNCSLFLSKWCSPHRTALCLRRAVVSPVASASLWPMVPPHSPGFWWPETWRNGCVLPSTAVRVLRKYWGSPKHCLLLNPVLHGEGGEVQPVL